MGAGALGSAVGGFLARAGYDVTLVGRENHMTAIQEKGLKISGIWGDHLIKKIRAETDTSKLPVQDLILLTTKSTDTEAAAKQIKKLIGEGTVIVSLQNGVGNEEILQKICGKDRVLGGMVIIGFELAEPGHARVTVYADKIRIGEMSHEMTGRAEKIAELFNKADLPTEAVDNIKQFLWGKLLYNSCLNPLGAILDVNYGRLREKHTRLIIREIIEETFKVTEKEGIKMLWKSPGEYEKFLRDKQLPPTADHRPSMLHDLERGRKTEIDFLNGRIVELGLKHKIQTPVNAMLCNLIKFRENTGITS